MEEHRAPSSRQRWCRLTLRAAVTVHAALALWQTVLAGRFLSGNYDALDLHAANAMAIAGTGLVQLVTAILLWRPGRGPWWPMTASLALVAAEVGEMRLGYARALAIHIPLGTTIVAAVLMLMVWSWKPIGRHTAVTAGADA
ncbi:hypothetical protein GCM10023205_54010 [Yinghuangia aomiensis]|uniref:Uncharacterized protein n=1 Tax=Yinghuangia aomiensis TaxID=676205 RepID=A0ABP9HVI0_9ACTN